MTNDKKKLNFGLLPRILVAIVLGIICGQLFPDGLTRVFVTFNGLFGATSCRSSSR